MKPSSLKQLLKSCKDGLYLTIQRQPGINLTSLVSIPGYRGKQTCPSSARLLRDLQETTSASLPLTAGTRPLQSQAEISTSTSTNTTSPGTPKSSISESSAGYHSLTHSMPPSESSNTLIGPSSEAPPPTPSEEEEVVEGEEGGGGGVVMRGRSLTLPVPGVGSGGEGRREMEGGERERVSGGGKYQFDEGPTTPKEGYASHRMGGGGGGGAGGSGFSKSSYRNRPSDFYSPRRHTASSHPSKPATTQGEHHSTCALDCNTVMGLRLSSYYQLVVGLF